MNKDVHDMDDLFRSALEGHEEIPSASVKERLETSLDKKDAESYKKKFIIWKRTALLLLFLLAGFILFDSGILQTGSGRSDKKTITEKTGTATKKDNTTIRQNNLPGEISKDESKNAGSENTNKKEESKNQSGTINTTITANPVLQKDIVDLNSTNHGTNKNPATKNAQQQKINTEKKSQAHFIEYKKGSLAEIPVSPGNNTNIPVTPDLLIMKWINYPAPLIADNAMKNKNVALQQRKVPSIHDSLLKKNISRSTNRGMKNRFNPYWLMAGFASYDRVNYKIDSDLPENITSIKHREVHEPSFSGGILATRQLAKHLGLQTGLVYSNTQIGISPQKMYAFQQPGGSAAYKYITSSGYAYIKPGFGPQPNVGDSLTTSEAKHAMHYFSIPLVIKYTTAGKKFSFTPGVGIEANFIASEKLEVELEDAFNREIVFINKLNGASSFYWSVTANTELRYHVNKKLSVSLRPGFRYALSTITKNNDVDTFPYNFGISVGITHKFK